MSDPQVFESKSTYYNDTNKKWIPGTFTLNASRLLFEEDEGSKTNICLRLCDISGLEKRQSSLIYPALVVSVGSEKHWFASFASRDTVYNLIELFWRESLLSRTQRTPSERKKSSSPLGKELLGILQESESSLVSAANALSRQGRQLEESEAVLEDVNTELSLAERFLKSMSFASVLLMKEKAEVEQQPKGTIVDEPRYKQYKIMFKFSTRMGECIGWEKGTLIFKNDIELLDDHQNKIFSIEIKHLNKLQISSPWEFYLTYSSGPSSKTCYIMCPQLSRLLKFVNSIPSIKRKIIFEDDNLLTESTACSSRISDDNTDLPLLVLTDETPDPPSGQQAQAQEESDIISDQDLREISNMLNSLQTLATEVTKEQQHQLEKINSLVADVDKTELRIKANNKEIKKKT